MNSSFCIIICGPTASGKTRVGIEIAKHFGAEIISADSRQCYRELNIGVARPTPEELAEVSHHFIADHSIRDNLTAAYFEQYALKKCASLFAQNKFVVMVGGTGLYIRAFAEGLDEIPPSDKTVREEIENIFQSGGLSVLQDLIRKEDPLFAQAGEMANPRRLMRALEVVRMTGKSILTYHTKQKPKRPFKIIRIGLELPREELYQRINTRVDKMMEAGLLEEVKSLLPYKHLPALQTVGYRELFEHLTGKISLHKAVEYIKQNTRHYAKRQMTWFKKDEAVHWFHPDALMEDLSLVDELLNKI